MNGQINTGTKQSNGFVKVSDRDGIRRESLLNHSQGISNLLKDVTVACDFNEDFKIIIKEIFVHKKYLIL